MAYSVTKLNIRQVRYPELYAYLDDMSRKAKLLRNAALFRIRNNFTIRGKDCPEFLDGYDIASVLRNLHVVRFETLYKVSG